MLENNIAIIPARGGSKRIPRKNIKDFLGKPIIAYSIEAALESNLVKSVLVSTDDEEIAEVAKRYGAEVPFFRSPKNSNDFAGTVEVILEVVKELKARGQAYDNVCCIYATAPFVSVKNLVSGYNLMREKNFDSVFPVCRFSSPIQRALTIENNGHVSMMWPENRTKRSQDLLPAYYDAGQFYWMQTAAVLSQEKIYTDNAGSIILDEMEVQDIDNLIDWQLAELKYKLLKN
jgi:N-acylneuraminate cytidylyltransferase